jgi:hypothetical protein
MGRQIERMLAVVKTGGRLTPGDRSLQGLWFGYRA